MGKLLYRPVGALGGMAAGMIAGALFKQAWKILTHQDDAPSATDENRRWGEVLAASAVQGAIFAVVKTAVDRGGAVGIRKVTGKWPA